MTVIGFRQVKGSEYLGEVPWTLDGLGRKHLGLEQAARIEALERGLSAAEVQIRTSRKELCASDEVLETIRLISQFHSIEYINRVSKSVENWENFVGSNCLDDTPPVPGRWSLALSAIMLLDEAVEAMADEGVSAYALIRPPGHHAGFDFSGGYCLINTAVASAFLLRQKALGNKIAILDLDYHFGNGTFDLAGRHEWIDYFSVHSSNRDDYPYNIKNSSNHRGFERAPSADEYLSVVCELLEMTGGAESLVVSLGFDGACDDPHGNWSLPPDVWLKVGQSIGATNIPILIVQEGGYNLTNLENCSRNFALGFQKERL